MWYRMTSKCCRHLKYYTVVTVTGSGPHNGDYHHPGNLEHSGTLWLMVRNQGTYGVLYGQNYHNDGDCYHHRMGTITTTTVLVALDFNF